MQNREYLLPGIAAIVLAVMFPMYWIAELSVEVTSLSSAVWANMQALSLSDVVFMSICLLSMYVYINLKSILNDRLNFKRIDILLLIMISANAVLIGTLFLDVAASILPNGIVESNKDVLLGVGISITVGVLIVCGLLDVVIGIVLLANRSQLPTLLQIFAVITLIQGIFEITVVLSPIALVIFPIALIVLAVFFFAEPETIELV